MHQRVQLIGRLGADPEVRFLASGDPVANIRIATDESYKNKEGEKVTRTEWHKIVMFSRLAEVASDYLRKGRLVMIEGKLRTRKWTDQNNVDRWTTEIIASGMRMLDKSTNQPQAEKAPQAAEPEPPADSEVPF